MTLWKCWAKATTPRVREFVSDQICTPMLLQLTTHERICTHSSKHNLYIHCQKDHGRDKMRKNREQIYIHGYFEKAMTLKWHVCGCSEARINRNSQKQKEKANRKRFKGVK